MTVVAEITTEDLGSTTLLTRQLFRRETDIVEVLNREIETLKAVVEQNRIDASSQAAEIKLYREQLAECAADLQAATEYKVLWFEHLQRTQHDRPSEAVRRTVLDRA